jgi:hypothetical protein
MLTHFILSHSQTSVLFSPQPVPDPRPQDVKAAVKGVQPAGTLAGRTANSIHWSPQGRNLVLAGLKVRRCLHTDTLEIVLLLPLENFKAAPRHPNPVLSVFHDSLMQEMG